MPDRNRGNRRRLGWKGALLLALGAGAAVGAGLAVGLWRRRRPWARADARQPSRRERQRAWVPGPAGTLYLEESGAAGLPVLLVHGLGGSTRHWEPALELLAAEHHVVALDLRGHGESDPAIDGEYHVEDYAADVLAVADALGLRRFVLAGHSVGGLVAVECAGRHPERVAALLLVDPSGDSSQLPREQVESSLGAVAKEPRGELELHFRQFLTGAAPGTPQVVLDDLSRVSEEVFLPSLESAMSYPAVESLARYSGPTACLVTPFNDSTVSLPRLLPELAVRRIRGTSHWLMVDRPEEIARALAGLQVEAPAATTS